MKIDFYPADWSQIARIVKEYNGWCCQACGCQCRRPGELNLGWQFGLTVAHYDHVYDAPEVFVVAMCIKCHFAHDAPFVWSARRRHERARRQVAGQLALFA